MGAPFGDEGVAAIGGVIDVTVGLGDLAVDGATEGPRRTVGPLRFWKDGVGWGHG